jgi:uncharacterized membrane protein
MNDEIKEYLQAGRKNLIVIYVLYLCGIIVPLLPIIGVISAYLNKNSYDRIYQSHYIFLIRTFLFGLGGIVVSQIATIIFIGPLIYFAVLIWFIARIVIGFKYLIDNKEHPNPLTFLIR